MRTIGASLVLIAACSSTAKSPQTPATQQAAAASNDSSLFPASWPSLRDAEAGGDPAHVAQLAQTALGQLDEEYELSMKDAGIWAAIGRDDAAGAAELRVAWAKQLFSALQVARLYRFDAMEPISLWSVTAWFGAATE